jgi:ubiquinone/menaquinone biosynthesis C-methylase UbiE
LVYVINQKVKNTYGAEHLASRLLDSLDRAGVNIQQLTPMDLLSFDELHAMGREATIALGALAALTHRHRVLDIGCGVGGPARTLTTQYGCRVVGVDLSPPFAFTADTLSQRVGLGHRLSFLCANALYLPFADNTFDTAFLFHVAVNIADKMAMVNELQRVLKSGGRLALWEVCQGSHADLIFPVPWSDNVSFSHLTSQEEMMDMIRTGFDIIHQNDATEEVHRWVTARMQSSKPSAHKVPRPDLDLVLPNFRLKRLNMSRNLDQGRITILQAVAVKK